MKRSTTATLLLMSIAPLMLTACDDPQAQNQAQAQAEAPAPAQIQSQAFKTIDDCTHAGNTPAECQTAFNQAQTNATAAAPHYATRDDCIRQFGPDMCQERSGSEGSFWGPLMTGFMISHMLGSSSPSYYGSVPVYTQSNGQFYSSTGSRGSYGSVVSTPASSDAGTRAITASRGGFGSESAARGSWGG